MRRRESADHSDHQLDGDEARHQSALQESRQVTADAHREQVTADDGGELKNPIAEQVTGQRAGDQFIDQPAGGDQKNREE